MARRGSTLCRTRSLKVSSRLISAQSFRASWAGVVGLGDAVQCPGDPPATRIEPMLGGMCGHGQVHRAWWGRDAGEGLDRELSTVLADESQDPWEVELRREKPRPSGGSRWRVWLQWVRFVAGGFLLPGR